MYKKGRTDFLTAVTRALEILKDGESYTQNKLAQSTDLNTRTIQKVLFLLGEVQLVLKDKEIDITALDNVKIIRMKEKSGLAAFPDNLQKLIIKTLYYPTTSREEEILSHLLMRSALNEKLAISISENKILQELVEAEFVSKTSDGRFYLTSDGVMTAKGAIELYPELKEIRGQSQIELDNAIKDYVVNKGKQIVGN